MLQRRKTAAGRPCALALIILVVLVAAQQHRATALPLQYLPEIPGYIPVYIRHGDQPLEEINPALAEAFHESTGILKNIQGIPLDDDRNDVSLDSREESIAQEDAKPPLVAKQLLFNLPQEKHLPKPKPTEKESVVMKLAKNTPSEKVELKKISKELKEKEGSKLI